MDNYKKDRTFEFADLSDGQRQLIVLYTILESLRNETYSVLLVDEPDNFISLREIQPWHEAGTMSKASKIVDLLADTCRDKKPFELPLPPSLKEACREFERMVSRL